MGNLLSDYESCPHRDLGVCDTCANKVQYNSTGAGARANTPISPACQPLFFASNSFTGDAMYALTKDGNGIVDAKFHPLGALVTVRLASGRVETIYSFRTSTHNWCELERFVKSKRAGALHEPISDNSRTITLNAQLEAAQWRELAERSQDDIATLRAELRQLEQHYNIKTKDYNEVVGALEIANASIRALESRLRKFGQLGETSPEAPRSPFYGRKK